MMKVLSTLLATTAICGILAVTPAHAAQEQTMQKASASTTIVKTRLTNKDVTLIQQKLADKGFYKSKVDGQFGPGTQDAVREYQNSLGIEANGYPTPDTLAKLEITLENEPVTGGDEPAGKGGVVYTQTVTENSVATQTRTGISNVESESQNGGNCLTCTNGPIGNGGTKSMHSTAF